MSGTEIFQIVVALIIFIIFASAIIKMSKNPFEKKS